MAMSSFEYLIERGTELPSSTAEGARDQDATSRRGDERTGAEVARTTSAAAGEGGPGARWSAWRGGGIMTGERRPVERSSDAGGDPAAGLCCADGAGAAAAAGGRGSDGAEASGVKKPTWRIFGSTPPDEERGGRRRSMMAWPAPRVWLGVWGRRSTPDEECVRRASERARGWGILAVAAAAEHARWWWTGCRRGDGL